MNGQWPFTAMAQLLETLEGEARHTWDTDESHQYLESYSPEERSGRADGIDFAINEIKTKYLPEGFNNEQ